MPRNSKNAFDKKLYLMICTCVITLLSYTYIFSLHVYGPRALHACFVCIICFYTYKGKRIAEVCYNIFSCIVILMGGIAIIFGVIKYSSGILARIRGEVIFVYILRAIFQAVSLGMMRKWKIQAKER